MLVRVFWQARSIMAMRATCGNRVGIVELETRRCRCLKKIHRYALEQLAAFRLQEKAQTVHFEDRFAGTRRFGHLKF